MAHSAEDIRAQVKVYFMVLGALLVLTLVTVAISYLHLPVGQAVALALVVATVKGSLVAVFFMHLKGEKPWVSWPLVLTATFVVLLFGLPLWTTNDPVPGTRPTEWSVGVGAAAPDDAHAPAAGH